MTQTPPAPGLNWSEPVDRVHAERIRVVLAAPGWGWLTGPVRRAWEQDLSRRRVRIDVDRLGEGQAAAMADFLRWPTHRQGTVMLDLERLDLLVRRSGLDAGLATCLVAAGGPLADVAGTRRSLTAARRAAGEQLWADAAGHPAVARHPRLAGWLADERLAGRLPGDPAVRAGILRDALTVLAALPDAGTGVGRLATRTLGHAHALDGTAVASAVLRAAGWLAGEHRSAPTAEQRRRLWASLGVALDSVSSTVLVLGLTLPGSTPLASGLRAHADEGLPFRITLGQLTHHLDRAGAGAGRVWVCENPSVVEEAAERLGARCAPLVCVEGRPSVAASRLLAALVADGSELRYHGDFDWAGLDIAVAILALGARPWRMSAADYRAGVGVAAVTLPDLPLRQTGAATGTDLELFEAMQECGRMLEEEHLLDVLIGDLAPPTADGQVSRP